MNVNERNVSFLGIHSGFHFWGVPPEPISGVIPLDSRELLAGRCRPGLANSGFAAGGIPSPGLSDGGAVCLSYPLVVTNGRRRDLSLKDKLDQEVSVVIGQRIEKIHWRALVLI